jgi:hypothetical protein
MDTLMGVLNKTKAEFKLVYFDSGATPTYRDALKDGDKFKVS